MALLSVVSEDSEEDEAEFDMDKTISEESKHGSLEQKKDFLISFLKRKLLELGDKQASLRTLGENENSIRKTSKNVRFKRGDNIFKVVEVTDDGEEVFPTESDEEFERIFVNNEKVEKSSKQKRDKGRNSKYPKKRCPIKCGKEHSYGSVFFCPIYRKKSIDERKAIQKKLYLCCTCLGKTSKEHDCPVRKCKTVVLDTTSCYVPK